jgi:hypothetical protein
MLEQNAIVIQDVVMIDENSQLPVKALTVFLLNSKPSGIELIRESSYTPRKKSKNKTTNIRGVIREKKKVILIFRSTI